MEDKFYLRKKSTVSLLLTSTLVACCVFVSTADAYNPHITHYDLTERSVELFNRDNAHRALTKEEQEWIAEGARDEDAPATRVVNHFFDPTTSDGLSGFSSSKEWAHSGSSQRLNRFGARDMTWETAVEVYESGDKELAYRILGHLLHLVQDATVPAHVRQDPHLHAELGPIVLEGYGGKDPYEQASEAFSAPNVTQMHIPNYGNFDAYLEHTAQYTNRNFLSMDSAGFYTYPALSRIEEGYVLASDQQGEYKILSLETNTPTRYFSSPIELKAENFSDPLVVADYWSHLAPTAIEHGAGVIELFHNSVKEPTPPEERGTFDTLFKTVTGTTSHAIASAQSTWDLIKFGWNRHAVNLASFSFALTTNNTPSLQIETYQQQREQQARNAFFNQLREVAAQQGETGATPTNNPAPIQRTQQEEATGGPAEGEAAFVTRVIDGDTIELSNGQRVRYIGIDAPELNSGCYAEAARQRNEQLVLNKEVTLVRGEREIDDYGRLLRFVWTSSTFVNQALIETGHAYAYDFGQPHEYSDLFAQRQEVARENQLGLWGTACQEELPEEIKEEQEEENKVPQAIIAPLLINEVRMQEYEFVEIFNPTDEAVPLAGYVLAYYPSTRDEWDDPSWHRNIPLNATIAPESFYTISFGPSPLPEIESDWHPYQSNRLAQTVGTIALFANNPKEGGQRIDALGWGDVRLAENVPFDNLPDDDGSVARPNAGGAAEDTNDNANDFSTTTTATPGARNIITAPVETKEDEEKQNEGPVGGGQEQPQQEEVVPEPISGVLITEIQVAGETARDEFIELYNSTENEIDLSGWKLRRKTSSGEDESALVSDAFFSGTLPAKHHFLIIPQAEEGEENPYTGSTQEDLTYSSASYSITNNNTVLLYDQNDFLIDKVGYGEATDFEGLGAAPAPAPHESISRIVAEGNYQDSDDNANDFELTKTANPQNTADELTIAEELWQSSLLSSDIRYPTTDATDNIYFSEGEGISSYDKDGQQRWRTQDVLAYEGASLSNDGSLLYTSGCRTSGEPIGCFFAAVSTNDGSLVAITQIDTSAENGGPTKPVVDTEGNIYVATTGSLPGSIWKFNPDGTLFEEEGSSWPVSWEVIDWEEMGITPARNYIERIQPLSIAEDSLLIAAEPLSGDHYLFAFDLGTGNLLWQKEAEQESITETMGVTRGDETSFYTPYRNSTEAGIASYSATDGLLKWRASFASDSSYVFSLGGDENFLLSLPVPNSGILYRFSRQTGEASEVFRTEDDSLFATPLSFDDENVYLADEAGIVRVFRMNDSQILWEYESGYSLQYIVPAGSLIYGITDSGDLVTLGHWVE